ncbi:MAG: 30S ribosomal protein S9 [Anaerolineae bacterium]|nr:30S ribosomal protein S9 [Anaerolineae bacterium]
MSTQYYEGVGRRKTSTARVRIYPGGTGSMVINDKPAEDFLSRDADVKRVMEPLVAVTMEKALNVTVHVNGGGVTGQADAICLGISRALIKMDPNLRGTLRAEGDLLTRDPRVKERKKPGLKRARKAPTYTKR